VESLHALEFIDRASSQLSTDIENANFEFYGKTLTGAVSQRPRDERALQTINGTGRSFRKIEKRISAEAKAKAEKMIKNLLSFRK
jgi:predicted metalloendopeptidase